VNATRTWDENRASINALWPRAEHTDEERRLWHEDLAGLDQGVLYDAIREAKRTHESLFPQIKWVHDAYREILAARRKASKPRAVPAGERLGLRIDPAEDARLAADFVALIDSSTRGDFDGVERLVLGKLPAMSSSTAVRVLVYARRRLLGEVPRFGRVTDSGDVQEFFAPKKFLDARPHDAHQGPPEPARRLPAPADVS